MGGRAFEGSDLGKEFQEGRLQTLGTLMGLQVAYVCLIGRRLFSGIDCKW